MKSCKHGSCEQKNPIKNTAIWNIAYHGNFMVNRRFMMVKSASRVDFIRRQSESKQNKMSTWKEFMKNMKMRENSRNRLISDEIYKCLFSCLRQIIQHNYEGPTFSSASS